MTRQPYKPGDIVVFHCKHIGTVDSLSRTIGKQDWSSYCKGCKEWVRIRGMASRTQKLQWMKGRLQNANGARGKSANVEKGGDAYSEDGFTL